MIHKIHSGRIDPIWDLQEIERLDYFYEPFNDSKTVDLWQKNYNQKFSTGMQADYRKSQPRCQQEIFQAICDQGFEFGLQAFSWYRMLPGDIIPEHTDTYANYCKYFNVPENKVCRILVLLQDWIPGFLLEVNGKSFSHYPAGTFIIWQSACPHMAGNLSQIPRYSLQITATINQ
jgi:hypothetical protein